MEKQKMNKFTLILLFLVLSIGLVQSSLGIYRQSDCVQIRTILNSTQVNISSLSYPNSTIAITEQPMTKVGSTFNYTFCDTSYLGTYVYDYYDEKGNVYINDFTITTGGDTFGLPQALLLLGQFGLIALFFGIALTFKQERWKLKTFFIICSLLMGIVFLNSIKIIIGTSANLARMGEIGLVLGIIILSFMFLYLLINYLIEVFGYFKNKGDMKWSVTPQ